MFKFFARTIISTFALIASLAPALADNWGGQPVPAPVTGSIGPLTLGNVQTQQVVVICAPTQNPPPCGPGQTQAYTGGGVFSNGSSLPAAVGDGSTVGVFLTGAYSDPSSPTGISFVGGDVPLSAFAQSSTVSGLATSLSALSLNVGALSTSYAALSASFGAVSSQLQSLTAQFAAYQRQAQLQNTTLRQGVAMSLAMDGVGDLGPGENVAISMNVGTYGGQNGLAAGVAVRAGDHLSFNGGIGGGVNGGPIGGRAGVRLAW